MALFLRTASALVPSAALLLAGCSGGGTTSPTLSAPLAIAGEYTGTVTDSVAGSQAATTTLSQHGAAIGGTLTIGSGQAAQAESVALTISGSGLNGSGTVIVNGATCTFAITGTYANNAITGTSTAVSGCAGRSGTLTLYQQCGNPVASAARRTQGVVPSC